MRLLVRSIASAAGEISRVPIRFACGLLIVGGWLSGCAGTSNPPSAVSTTPPAAVPGGVVPAIEPAAVLHEPANQPGAEPLPKPADTTEPVKPRPILGKKTADIRDAQIEEAKGAQRVQPRVTGQDPITISGSAYVSIIGRTEVLTIQHSLDLYHAETGRYPKDHKEFMAEIIHKNGIRLAQLPFYQEYGYDAPNHQLVILEYPDRKAAAGQ